MFPKLTVIAILLAAMLAGCSIEQQLNRQYVASLKALNQLQPVRQVQPAQRECDTCHRRSDMRAPQKLLRYYPVRISHKKHAMRGIDCVFCHRNAATSAASADYLMPGPHADAAQPDAYSLQPQAADANPCKTCHIHYEDKERDDPGLPARCETCHIDYQPGKEVPFARIPQQRIRNNHKVHQDNGIMCLRCHVGFDAMEETTLNFTPRMNICMECHDLPTDTIKARSGPAPESEENWLKRADRLYAVNCSPCHGPTGRGDGPMTPFFRADLQPRDHTDGFYMAEKSDEQLFDAIWKGGRDVNRSIRMPAFEKLITEEDARMLVRYIRWLSQSQPPSAAKG